MSIINANPLLAAAGGDYQISRSVRLRSSASAYFNRTPASAGNRQIWTWSAWVKQGSALNSIFSTNSSDNLTYNYFGFDTNAFRLYQWNGSAYDFQLVTTAVYRDPSAWYHFVVQVDTTQSTATNRVRLYVNGVQVTSFSTNTTPSQNLNTYVNSTSYSHLLGRNPAGSTTYTDCYLTEVNFIDGQALTPSSFGETDAVTGVWKPKKYTGTYGTNGFYLNFSDNSNNTAATIGKDYSGNGNNWTPNNISVTSGVTYDSMLDVPTQWADGGNGRGNYCVLNPLDNSQGTAVILDGNLKVSYTAATGRGIGTIFTDAGKWYAEFTAGQVTASNADAVGICGVGTASSVLRGYAPNGQYFNGSTWASYGATYTAGDVIGVAVDVTSQTLEFFKNNVSQGQKTSIGLSLLAFVAWTQGASGNNIAANFGQRPFAYTPPTGFVALNTQNLPDSTIKKGNQYFNAVTWTGDGVDGRTITGVGFNPDLVWAKGRSNTGAHVLADAVRGTNANLYTNLTDAETNPTTGASGGGIGSVTTDGFVLEQGSTNMDLVNTSSRTYVAWQWKESATAGFDIVTFTNPSSGSSSFAHNLGVKPSMIIVKSRSNTSNWTTMHKSLGTNMADNWINLESTAAKQTSTNIWGGEPTSSVFFCGTGIQVAGATMVAYLFAEVAGFSKFGSYTGNGSTDGPFVYCGFRPRFVLVKQISGLSDWWIWDTSRETYNQMSTPLFPNTSGAEASNAAYQFDILSNGFKMRNSNATVNGSGLTYIFAAFAETAFKFSLGR